MQNNQPHQAREADRALANAVTNHAARRVELDQTQIRGPAAFLGRSRRMDTTEAGVWTGQGLGRSMNSSQPVWFAAAGRFCRKKRGSVALFPVDGRGRYSPRAACAKRASRTAFVEAKPAASMQAKTSNDLYPTSAALGPFFLFMCLLVVVLELREAG